MSNISLINYMESIGKLRVALWYLTSSEYAEVSDQPGFKGLWKNTGRCCHENSSRWADTWTDILQVASEVADEQ